MKIVRINILLASLGIIQAISPAEEAPPSPTFSMQRAVPRVLATIHPDITKRLPNLAVQLCKDLQYLYKHAPAACATDFESLIYHFATGLYAKIQAAKDLSPCRYYIPDITQNSYLESMCNDSILRALSRQHQTTKRTLDRERYNKHLIDALRNKLRTAAGIELPCNVFTAILSMKEHSPKDLESLFTDPSIRIPDEKPVRHALTAFYTLKLNSRKQRKPILAEGCREK